MSECTYNICAKFLRDTVQYLCIIEEGTVFVTHGYFIYDVTHHIDQRLGSSIYL